MKIKCTTVFCILSKHIFVGQQSGTNLLHGDKKFIGQTLFSEFLSFELVFNSEKSPPTKYLVAAEKINSNKPRK